jgi:hypothetical protein
VKKMAVYPIENITASIEAQRLSDNIRSDLDTLRGAPQRLADLLAQTRQEVIQAEADGTWRLTPAGMEEIVSGIRNRTLQQIDSLEQACQAAREAIERTIADAEKRADADPQTEVLNELREQRAWNRIRPILDRLENNALVGRIGELARNAAEAGDDATLRALEAEVQAFLEAKGVASYIAPVVATIRDARLPHLPPAARKAVQVRQELEAGWPRLMAAFMQARQEATGRGGKVLAMPGWNPSERVTF